MVVGIIKIKKKSYYFLMSRYSMPVVGGERTTFFSIVGVPAVIIIIDD